MKTLTKLCTLLAAVSFSATSALQAAPVWDFQTLSISPATSELAKEGLAVTDVGITYSVGYVNGGTSTGAQAYVERRTAAGVCTSATFRPVAGDSYYYTGVYTDGAGASLFVTGTHYSATTGAHEMFVRRLIPATLVAYTAGGWGLTGTKYFTPGALLGLASTAKHSFGGRVLANSIGLFVSASTEHSLHMVKLIPSSGALGAGWPITRGQPVSGVRSLVGRSTAAVPMPGSVPGGLFNSTRPSFIEVKGQDIVLAGSLDLGAGARFDGVLGVCNMAAAGLPTVYIFDNAGQDELVHALAATTRGLYLAGHTAGSSPTSFVHVITLGGTAPPPYTATGPVNSTAFDVEVRNTATVDDIFVGVTDPATGGIVYRYTNNGTATVASFPWASRTYGVPGDAIYDVSYGTVAPNVGSCYATGSLWDATALGRRMAPMRVTPAGVATVDTTLFARPISGGVAILFSPVFSAVFSTGNALDTTGAFITENARHNR
jgi:hypothetical protein